MKRLLFFALLIGLSGCEFYYYDPVYDSRERVIGRYDVEEYSETFNDYTSFSVWIERSNNYSDEVWIDNFYAVNISVRAVINYDKLTIPRQVVNGYEVEGVGTIYASSISLSYRVKDLYNNSRTDFLEATAYKQY
ncbi:MAG: hypothetical protein QY309_03570 [Cyclobacteriaceae bacterium]|nr:MAG: hypothetical protein QY309_03570 [Cyclobacteriaceae bacterium]